jgi:gliding motility-associated-like protein
MKRSFVFLFFFISAFWCSAQTYFLNGSATYQGGDCYLLTPAVGTMNGTVWYAEQVDLNVPFDLEFTMNFGTLDANGADGMCFVLQTVGTNAIGASGGGMGYQTFGTSLGIEFDTYYNGNFNDPSYDHIAIEYNGNISHGAATGHIAGPVQASSTSANIEDGQDHSVRITWNPATMLISVYFDCVHRLDGTFDLINNIFGGESLVYWGFTAATGGSYNNQSVCLREDILAVTEVAICAGASAQLQVTGSADGTYTWSPTDFLSNSTIGNPIASPIATTTYTVSYIDDCGILREQPVTVSVDTLEILYSNPQALNCAQTQVTLNVQSSLDIPTHFTWTLNGTTLQQGDNLTSWTAETPGEYIIQAHVDNVCFAQDTITLTSNYDLEIISTVPQQLSCVQTQVSLNVQTNPNVSAYFIWTLNGVTLQQGNNITTLSVQTPGEYIIQAEVENLCFAQDTITVLGNYVEYDLEVSDDLELNCDLPQTTLTTESAATNVIWYHNNSLITDQTSHDLVISTPGIYTVVVIHPSSGCMTEDEIIVTLDLSTPVVIPTEQHKLTCIDPQLAIKDIIINSAHEYSIQWTALDGNIVSGGTSISPIVNQAGTYSIEVQDDHTGCSTTAYVIVEESDDFRFNMEALIFPNVITPNGDASNQYWRPFSLFDPQQDLSAIFKTYNFQVFDRWGKKIFETTSYSKLWDAKELGDGTYFYLFSCETYCEPGEVKEVQGHVLVSR